MMKIVRSSVFSVFLLISLSGCGFSPLYADLGTSKSLSQVALKLPDTRTGYFLEQQLRQNFQADLGTQKAYELEVKLTENHYSIGYRADDTSTRAEMNDYVTYSLVDKVTGKVILAKSFDVVVTYNASTSPYADITSQQDAQKRIAGLIAQHIQTDLAVFFQGRS